MKQIVVSTVVLALASTCGSMSGNSGTGGGAPGGVGGSSGGSFGGAGGGVVTGGGAGGSSGSGELSDVPCAVADLLRARCVACHGTRPIAMAPMSLTNRAELLGSSPLGGTYAARSVMRMKDTANPMPPSGPPPAQEVAAFEAWVSSGAAPATCTSRDGGVTGITPTCETNRFWPDPYEGSGDMNPGLACRSCHAGMNFKGQNPDGRSEPGRLYAFSGTLFSSANVADGCQTAPPTGVTVEIVDKTGAVQLTLTPRAASGNFYSSQVRSTPAWLPYTARLRRNGQVVATMKTLQMSGDCNTCHTATGDQGAPGRITIP